MIVSSCKNHLNKNLNRKAQKQSFTSYLFSYPISRVILVVTCFSNSFSQCSSMHVLCLPLPHFHYDTSFTFPSYIFIMTCPSLFTLTCLTNKLVRLLTLNFTCIMFAMFWPCSFMNFDIFPSIFFIARWSFL